MIQLIETWIKSVLSALAKTIVLKTVHEYSIIIFDFGTHNQCLEEQ